MKRYTIRNVALGRALDTAEDEATAVALARCYADEYPRDLIEIVQHVVVGQLLNDDTCRHEQFRAVTLTPKKDPPPDAPIARQPPTPPSSPHQGSDEARVPEEPCHV